MKTIKQPPTDPRFVQNPYKFYQRILEFNEVCFWEDYKFKAFFDFKTINKIFEIRDLEERFQVDW